MNEPNSTIRTFYESNKFENLQETEPFKQYLHIEEYRLRNEIRKGQILEIGCGNGRIIPMILRHVDKYVGVDFSKRLIKQAQIKYSNNPKVELFLEDAQKLHFTDESFDACLLVWNTFGNLYNLRDKVLSEVVRVTKPGGKVIFSVFSERVLEPYLVMLKHNKLISSRYDDDYVYLQEGMISERFTKEKLEGICRKAGLEPQVEKLTDISYWCVARKLS